MRFNKVIKIIIIVALLILAYFIGKNNVINNSFEKDGYDVGYVDGYDVAWNEAELLIDSAVSPIFPAKKEIFSIGGAIKNISIANNSMTVEAGPVSANPLSDDSKPTVRIVKIIPATKIVKFVSRTSEETQAMIKQNQIAMPFSEEEITFSQLKEGDRITITSDRNIKKEMEFTALKIALQQKLGL